MKRYFLPKGERIFVKNAAVLLLLSATLFGSVPLSLFAYVAPVGGMAIYADTTNAGQLKSVNLAGSGTMATSTLTAEISTAVGAASAIRFAILKTNPTRPERAAAILKADGSLNVLLYNASSTLMSTSTATNAWINQFTVTGVGTTEQGRAMQAVDMFYESKTGKLVVVYGKSGTNGSFFYQTWNGNTWSGELSQAVTDLAGPAHWITAAGLNGSPTGSNTGGIGIIDDTNNRIYASYWNGSAWANTVQLASTTNATSTRRVGVAFENTSGKMLAVYGPRPAGAANNAVPWWSNVLTPGGSWSATTSLPAAGASSVSKWVQLASGPLNEIAMESLTADRGVTTTAPTHDPYLWNGSSWFKGTTDTTAGDPNGESGFVIWEQKTLPDNPTPQAVWQYHSSLTDTNRAIITATSTLTTFSTVVTPLTGGSPDDTINYSGDVVGDRIMVQNLDIDCDLALKFWDGTRQQLSAADHEASAPDACANATGPFRPQYGRAHDFNYNKYNAWMRNWEWFDDAGASMAAENATSTLTDGTTYHLRINLHETGSTTQSAASKKVQYTTSVTPDDSGATWTDVGAQGSAAIWRYANGSGTELAELPNKQLASTTLNGVYLESAFASTTHATSSVQEYDYAIQPNSAGIGTTYSFRLYDNEFDRPVLRKQDLKSGAKCGTDAIGPCWYPAATVAAAVAPTATISGILYGLNRITPDTTGGRIIKMRIGTSTPGFFSTTTIAGTGVWQIPDIVTTNWYQSMPIHTWIDGDPLFNAFSFTKASSTSKNITGLDLIRNRVLVKHEGFTATSTTDDELGLYDFTSDPDIKFDYDGATFQVFKSQELMVAPGTHFTPGVESIIFHGNASTTNPDGDLYLASGLRQDGTATTSIMTIIPNSTLAIAGNWFASSSAIFINSGVISITFTSTSSQQKSIIATSTPFSTLDFNGIGGSWKFTEGDATTTGSFFITNGSVTAPSGNLSVGGDYSNSGTFTHNSGTTTFNGGSQSISGTLTDTSAFGGLEFSGASTKSFISTSASSTGFTIRPGTGEVRFPTTGLTIGGHFLNFSKFKNNGGTVYMTGTAATLSASSTNAGANGFNNLIIDPSSAGIVTISTTNVSASSTLSVASGDTLSIGSGRIATSTGAGIVTIDGTISGTGTLVIENSNLSTGGTLSAPVRFYASSTAALSIPARTYGGLVEIYSPHATNATTTLGSGAHSYQGALNVLASGAGGILVNGASNNPTVSVTGDVDFTGAGAGSETVWSGTGGWTLSGNADFTNGSFLASTTNLFTMNGSAKTLTSASATFGNLTLSGSITLSGDVAAAGSVDFTGGTVTAPGQSVRMSGTGATLIGGGNTIRGLWISGGDTTLSAFDLTVGTSTVSTGATLTIGAGRNLTATSTMTLTGTLSGTGTTTFGNATYACSNIPSGGTLSVNVRADATAGNCTIPQRTYGANVEAYSNSAASARTIFLPSPTVTISGGLFLNAANTQNLTVDADTNGADPVNVGGNLDFIGVGAGSEIMNAAVTLDVNGYVDISDGTLSAYLLSIGKNYTNTGGTFTHNSGTTTFDGTTAQTIAGTLTGTSVFGHLEFSGAGTKAFSANASTSNFFINAGSGAVTAPSGLLSISGQYSNSGTFTHNSGKVYANGADPQRFSGTMINTSAFNNFEIINSTATTTFGASASTTGTFTVVTPNVKVAFAANATTTLENLTVNGQAPGTEVRLWSATPGSRWNIHVPGTRSVSYASIMDSDACNSSGNIDVTNGTNINKGNNVCWDFTTPAPVIDLVHYRFRADNGSESGASYLQGHDTAVTSGLFVGDKVRLRFAVQNTGNASASSVGYRLEHASSTQTCGAWIAVPTSNTQGTHWTMSESSNVANNASTTQFGGVTAADGKSFVAGYVKTTENQTNGLTLTTAQYTELEYSLRSTSAVSTAAYYCFRLTNVGATTNFVYTISPQITVSPAPNRPQGGGNDGGGEGGGGGAQQGGGGQGGGGGGEEGGGGGQQGGGGAGGGGGGDSG